MLEVLAAWVVGWARVRAAGARFMVGVLLEARGSRTGERRSVDIRWRGRMGCG